MPVLSRRSALGGGPPRRLSATPPHGSTRVAGSEASARTCTDAPAHGPVRATGRRRRARLLTVSVIAPSVRSISQKRAHIVNHKMVQGARANLRRATQAKERADGPEHKKASTRKRLPTERGVRPLSALSRRARSLSLSLLYVCVLVPHAQAPLLSSGGLAASSWVARGSAHLFSAHLLALEELAQRHEAHVLKGGDALVSDA